MSARNQTHWRICNQVSVILMRVGVCPGVSESYPIEFPNVQIMDISSLGHSNGAG